jgi:transcriptional regulator with XRE-family HTH domain
MKLEEHGENTMEIKKTAKGFEVDGISFDTIDVAERYCESLQTKEKGDTAWLDEKIDYAFDPAMNNPSFKNFVENIAQANSHNLKQIASKIGVTRQTLYNWMDGKVIPDPASIDKICKAFNVSKKDVTLATIDNFANAYPELIGAMILSMQDCEILIGYIASVNSVEAVDAQRLRAALGKVKSIQDLWVRAKKTTKLA